MSANNTVRVMFEAVMDKFQKNVKQGIKSVLQIGDASKVVSKDFKGVGKEVESVNSSVEKLNRNIKMIAGAVIAKGAAKAIINIGTGFAKEYAKTQTAIGEMASLGYESSELLRETAISFSNKWAGTTREGFISAAYDIKSGISTLTDEGVAQFTELAGVTAKATKASIEEMTSLFATGYGIYRNFYESDFDFGESFSAGIAKSVQQFKTNGSQMSGYLSTLGSSAAQAGAELSEVLTIGGTLQATMTGSEAATKYNSFLKNAVKAAGELGMKFTDSNNRLLPAVDIIEMIKGKYGEILDAKEQAELAKAFGDDEAIKFITGLYNKTEELKQSQKDVTEAIHGGKDAVEAMGNSMNKGIGEKLTLIKQNWANLKDEIGKQMEPGISSALDEISNKLIELQGSADFSVIGQSVGEIVRVIGELFTNVLNGSDGLMSGLASGLSWVAENIDKLVKSVGIATGVWIAFKGVLMIGEIVEGATTAIHLMTGAQWAHNAALLASPISWFIAAVVALVGAIALACTWFVKANGGIESVGNTFKNTVDGMKVKWYEFKKTFLEGLQDIVEHIPLIGNTLTDSLERSIDKAQSKIDKLQNKMNERNISQEAKDISKQRKDHWEAQQDYYSKKYPGTNKEMTPLPQPEVKEPGVGSEVSVAGSIPKLKKKERTIRDDISDITDKYDHELDLYESRSDLAEKSKDKASVKTNKEAMIQVLNKQVKDLLSLEGKVKGKDKNIVETAKNKLLGKITDIAEGIRGGVDKLVGDFNKPSELTSMSKYEYLTATTKTSNSKYMNTNNIEMLIKVNDLGKTSMKQLDSKLGQMAQMVGSNFGGKNSMVNLGMNDVSRN